MTRGADLDRVAIVGTSCSGKTTLARRLAAVLDSQQIELDALHWGPDWQSTPTDVLIPRVEAALDDAERWVVDGNYDALRPAIWSRATRVVWLDYRFPLVLWRGLRRTLKRVATREELYSGNRETFAKSFLSSDSVLIWLISTHGRNKQRYEALLRDPGFSSLHFTRCTSPASTEAFIREIEHGSAAQRGPKEEPPCRNTESP